MKSSPRALKSKILSPATLAKKLKAVRARKGGPKVVFTNGVFDILHRGHVTYLEKARACGDLLVMAVNADESVRRLKGPTRPLNALEDRMIVLAALECVDYVTWFEEDTPLKLILRLKPDVLVKGGDWKPEQIVGSKEAKEWGGKTRSLSFVKGRSTTGLVKKIQNQ